jgi:CheY-like chemotaxis protein
MQRPLARCPDRHRADELAMKILVVEDEELVRIVAVDALEEAGFEVIEAATGEEAMERCREQIADALFTDIRLPGKINGWDVAEHCRTVSPNLPVIYATAYSHAVHRRVPGSRFFQKPYHPEHVIKAFRDLLGQAGHRT